MKKLFATFMAASTLAFYAQAADVSAKITDVHICCQSCVKGVEKAIAKVPGATVTVDQDAETVTLTGPDTATTQKAADELVAVNEALSAVPGVQANTAAKGAKSFEVTGDFNDKDVFDALQKAGLTGTAE